MTVSRSVGWLVGWLVGCLVGWSAVISLVGGRSGVWSLGDSVSWSVRNTVTWLRWANISVPHLIKSAASKQMSCSVVTNFPPSTNLLRSSFGRFANSCEYSKKDQ